MRRPGRHASFPRKRSTEAPASDWPAAFAHFDLHGFGPWSVEIKGGASYIGFVGLMVPAFETHFTPCVEVGWRLARKYWGRGYATGVSAAVLAGLTPGCTEIVSMTVPGNRRSRAVMVRLGMKRRAEDDFDHPNVPEGQAAPACALPAQQALIRQIDRNAQLRAGIAQQIGKLFLIGNGALGILARFWLNPQGQARFRVPAVSSTARRISSA